MEFHQADLVFYAAVAMSGIVGGALRLLRDRVSYGVGGNTGRFLSSGLVSFGVVGIWIGDNPVGVANPFYYLAIASSIGYASHDMQERIYARGIDLVLDKLGFSKKDKE